MLVDDLTLSKTLKREGYTMLRIEANREKLFSKDNLIMDHQRGNSMHKQMCLPTANNIMLIKLQSLLSYILEFTLDENS